MASCINGALQGIFETVCLAGGLSGDEFVTSTSVFIKKSLITAVATSCGTIFLYCQRDGRSIVKVIPLNSEENVKPAALAFSPTADWILVATEDGRLCIIPVGKYILGFSENYDHRFPVNDVIIHQPNGSRARPTAIVWWQTVTGDASVAIIGTELGELCFVELTSGKDVGGTYITVPVKEMFLCQDNSQDTVYMLITGTEDRQWRLVLEQKSQHYMFPLENISPEWDEEDNLVGSLSLAATAPSPRLRLMNLKQLSVEKFQLLKQRLSESKYSSRKKPAMENKGVDTCDINEEPSPNSTIITPHTEAASATVVTSISSPVTTNGTTTAPTNTCAPSATITESTSSETEHSAASISTRPERLSKFIHDVVACPQFTKEKCLLAGHYKPNSCLMVYSTDLESTPLYVYKLPEDTEQVILHEEILFALRKGNPPRISVVSTFYAASNKIDGEIDNKIDPVLQDIYLPEGEEILHLFPCPPSPTCASSSKEEEEEEEEAGAGEGEGAASSSHPQEMDDTDSEFDYEVDLPSHTKPNACLVVTKTSIFLCQTRKSVENLFMELALGAGEIEAANRLAAVFSLSSKLFELAADFKLQKRCFASAIMLYKQSRCPHVKCSLKFAWAGFVPEFITYMSSLTNGAGGPDLGCEQRKHLATLAVIAHLHQLSLPMGVRTLQQQQTTLRNLLLLLRNNAYYDEILTLVVATATWRWETLQYLASNRGLLLEKLHALLYLRNSPIMESHTSKESFKNVCVNEDKNGLNGSLVCSPVCREKEKGFLHCISDPELRGVLLLNPLLARSHMAFVLDHLDSLDVAVLRRLAALYDPTQPAIKPFLLSASYFHKPAMASYSQTQNSKSNQQCSLLPPASDDPIGLDTLTQIFLAILIKLNQKRGWKYNPELLTLSTIEPQKKKGAFYHTSISKKPLACGYGHSVVIIDRTLYSWGLGDYGALGHGSKSPTHPALLQRIDPIVCTELKELTSNENGPELFSAKKEPLIQSPEGTNGECFQPRPISYLSNMKTFSVSCGKNFTLAITNYGVYGWGNNRYGQLGTGGTGRHPRPTLVTALVNAEVIQVACGQFHSLGVTKDGKLYTWGWGVHGQLGHGNVEDYLKPTLVKKLQKQTIVAAGGGYAHSVALTEKGVVYAWGCSTYGQVGRGGISKVTLPSRVHFSHPVTHIATAYFHNVAVTSNHNVYVWGSNPACLRVQAQLQRKNRSALQQQPQKELDNGHDNPPPPPPTPDDSESDAEGKDRSRNADGINGPPILHSSSESFAQDNQNEAEKQRKCETMESLSETSKETNSPHTQNSETELNSTCEPCVSPPSGSHLVSANTVPSCDPTELSHLLPKKVEMPCNFGVIKGLAVGNQHSLLLTTHGALYAWGRNMSGQLGTGNRKESLVPVRVLEDVSVTEISAGADFSLAIDADGQVWGWGSNYYSQLGQGGNSSDDKGQGNKVFMLRTSKRVLKVPHSIHSNVEVPRPVTRLPLASQATPHASHYMKAQESVQIDLNDLGILSGVEFATLETAHEDISEKDIVEDKDDGLYGTVTLHSSLAFLHHHYSPKSLAQILLECEGHQALATLYTLEKQHSKAMHHQLCALLSHTWVEKTESRTVHNKNATTEAFEGTHTEERETEDGFANKEGKGIIDNAYSSSHVNEAVRILDRFLRLQTEESQSGMRMVLQEGIGLWLTHSLPIPQLEDLLLTHLPRTVYPLALLLFGDEKTLQNADEPKEAEVEHIAEATAKILSQLSTKFCLNLCSSVISHLQAGECNMEQLDALGQLVKSNAVGTPSTKDSVAGGSDEEKSPYNSLMESLEKTAPDAILLSPEEVSSLKTKSAERTDEEKGSSSLPSAGTKSKKESLKSSKSVDKDKDKDCVLFTCGHHFTQRDFKAKVLPQLEKTVTTVPGLLGKTARVLLDQYHSDQPQMACPHCVLAHLTIKLTKHNQPT